MERKVVISVGLFYYIERVPHKLLAIEHSLESQMGWVGSCRLTADLDHFRPVGVA